jgi:hypothetical protein
METAMSNKARNTSGKFAAKSETPRKIRSVNLTDDAWQWLADVATKAGVSRNDYLEAMAEGNPLIETVKPQTSPLIKTASSEIVSIVQPRISDVSPLIETASRAELEETKISYKALLDSSTHITNKLREEVAKVRSQLEAERADREEVETELSDLKQKSAQAVVELPEAADLLNQLKGRRKKSKTDLADVEAILGMIEESTIPVGN